MKSYRWVILAVLLLLTGNGKGLTVSEERLISLDGDWELAVDPRGEFTVTGVNARASWRRTRVPCAWQVQHPDLREYAGVVWYRKSFTCPPLDDDSDLLVRFDGADWLTRVFVNGQPLGEHEGGYTPFEFNLTERVHPGENELLVRILDPPGTETGIEGLSLWQIPHGKQSWYEQNSGLWQSVRLEVRPRRRITRCRIDPELNGQVRLELTFSSGMQSPSRLDLHLQVKAADGVPAWSWQGSVPGRDTLFNVTARVENPRLWAPGHPHLYTLTARTPAETVTERFGFRSIEARDGQLFLNGEPLYIRGALDQDFYPESQYAPPDRDLLVRGLAEAKALNLNLVRYHVKIPVAGYLDTADELGLLVWVDLPNWDVFTPAAARRGEILLEAFLERDRSHPSLAIISLLNESWGVDLSQSGQRSWLLDFWQRAKQLAPGRLVVDNSPCWGNWHLATDINDYHTYWSIPGNRQDFDRTIQAVAGRPAWLFSPHGDSRPTGQEPLLISEFGNWGLPTLGDTLPWWQRKAFQDFEFSGPEGVFERFREFQYGRLFPTYNHLARATQQAQFAALKYEIESLLLTPRIRGYVITELTDVNWEGNGLLTMEREPKVYQDELARVQTTVVIIPRPERYTVYGGDKLAINLSVSNNGTAPLRETILRWSLTPDISGARDLPVLPPAGVTPLAALELDLPGVEVPELVRIEFVLRDRAGVTRARNYCELQVFPRPDRETGYSVAVHDPGRPAAVLPEFLPRVFGPTDPGSGPAVLVSTVLDDGILATLRQGGRVLYLAGKATALPPELPFTLTARDSRGYDGNWISSFTWAHPARPPFEHLSTSGLLGLAAGYATPRALVTGLPGKAFGDVLAGAFVGWLHLNAGIVVQLRVGAGRLLVCTWELGRQVDSDPFSAYVLKQLIHYLAGEECRPRLAIE